MDFNWIFKKKKEKKTYKNDISAHLLSLWAVKVFIKTRRARNSGQNRIRRFLERVSAHVQMHRATSFKNGSFGTRRASTSLFCASLKETVAFSRETRRGKKEAVALRRRFSGSHMYAWTRTRSELFVRTRVRQEILFRPIANSPTGINWSRIKRSLPTRPRRMLTNMERRSSFLHRYFLPLCVRKETN